MPKFASFAMLFAMANAGLPATSGFVGEFLVIMGAMQTSFWIALSLRPRSFSALPTRCGCTSASSSAQSRMTTSRSSRISTRASSAVLAALAAAVLLMGIYPLPFTEVMHASTERAAAPYRVTQDMSSMEFLSHLRALPEMWVLVATCVLMILDLYSRDEQRRVAFYGAQAIVGVAFFLTLYVVYESEGTRQIIFNGMYVSDVLGHLLKLVCYVATSAALVYSRQYLADRGLLRGEFVTLLLFSLLGMMVMISAASCAFVGLELMSLCLYATMWTNSHHRDVMKYFVLGALSSGRFSTACR